MATTSQLRTKMDEETLNNASVPWTTTEAAVELVVDALGTPPTGASATQVQGAAADGAALVGNPVLVGGTDGTNAQTFGADTSGNQKIVGNVSSAATDSGAPVKVGGVYRATQPTFTDGQRGDLQHDSKGQITITAAVTPVSQLQSATATVAGIPVRDSTVGRYLAVLPGGYNGSTIDAHRSNLDVIFLASAAQTLTQTGADITNYNHRGIHLVISVTSAGSGSITPSIQGKDANGIYYNILVGTAITTNSVNTLKLYPGITTVANGAASDVLPRTFRIVITADNSNSITYSVAYSLIV